MATTDVILAEMVKVWDNNDPKDSESQQIAGQMRRTGRRDIAVQVIGLITGREKNEVIEALKMGLWDRP